MSSEPIEKKVIDHERGGVRFFSGGHWWFSRDPDAGTRAYTSGGRPRAWHGFYNGKVADHYTGGPLTIYVFPANTQERSAYPAMYERARTEPGADPLLSPATAATRTPQSSSTTRAAASPLSSPTGARTAPRPRSPRQPTSGTSTASRAADTAGPAATSSASSTTTAVARESGSNARCPSQMPAIGCRRSAARRTRRDCSLCGAPGAYAAMRETHGEYERVHHFPRVRYLVGPDTLSDRPKRIGSAWQQLRSSAAMFLEWLRICLRQGWVGRGGPRAEARPLAAASLRASPGGDRSSDAPAEVASHARARTREGIRPPQMIRLPRTSAPSN